MLVMTLRPPPAVEMNNPPQWKLVTASLRLPVGDPLTRFKTANKLAQIFARAEADEANADEALLVNTNGHVAETASGNLFWIEGDTIYTAPLAVGALPGVTRSVILELCRKYKFPAREADISPDKLVQADGIFLTLSSWGMVEVVSLDGRKVSVSPVFKKLWTVFCSELLLASSV
jgi:branched-subunit amino acid aminotransferase/4-amino-4-deoxychorismate lyase